MFSKLKIVPTATVSDPKRFEIRDIDDAPIMAAALDEDVDMIITGDRDFFSGGYVFPFAVTPARFAAIDEWMMEEEIEWPPAPFLDS
jgi:predicted nucleic acid-binding protein